jgi:hypothetical protein
VVDHAQLPVPQDGLLLTHFLTVRAVAVSRQGGGLVPRRPYEIDVVSTACGQVSATSASASSLPAAAATAVKPPKAQQGHRRTAEGAGRVCSAADAAAGSKDAENR